MKHRSSLQVHHSYRLWRVVSLWFVGCGEWVALWLAPVKNLITPGAGPFCGSNFTISFFVPFEFQVSGWLVVPGCVNCWLCFLNTLIRPSTTCWKITVWRLLLVSLVANSFVVTWYACSAGIDPLLTACRLVSRDVRVYLQEATPTPSSPDVQIVSKDPFKVYVRSFAGFAQVTYDLHATIRDHLDAP